VEGAARDRRPAQQQAATSSRGARLCARQPIPRAAPPRQPPAVRPALRNVTARGA